MNNQEASNKQPSSPREKEGCLCPYCDKEIMQSLSPFCQSCGVVLNYCSTCQVAVASNLDRCPECGGPIKKKDVI